MKKPTQGELAQKLGVTQQMVSKLRKRGMPVDSVAKARAWRRTHLDPMRTMPGDPVTADALRLRKLAAEITWLETKAGIREGQQIPPATLEKVFNLYFIFGRQKMDALHSQILQVVEETLNTRMGEPGYTEMYSRTYSALRHAWVHCAWMTLVELMIKERPEWARWFKAFADAQNGRRAEAPLEESSQ